MYSLGDIRFKKPKSLKQVAYVLAFLFVWSVPVYLVFGIHFNLFYALFWIGIPVAAGVIASKPIFGGKGLIDYTITLVGYLQEPKAWTDLYHNNNAEEILYVDQEIWISRRRELKILENEEMGSA